MERVPRFSHFITHTGRDKILQGSSVSLEHSFDLGCIFNSSVWERAVGSVMENLHRLQEGPKTLPSTSSSKVLRWKVM